jgi:hypothetical protein
LLTSLIKKNTLKMTELLLYMSFLQLVSLINDFDAYKEGTPYSTVIISLMQCKMSDKTSFYLYCLHLVVCYHIWYS